MIGKHKRPGLVKPPGARLLRLLPLKFTSRHGHGGKRSGYAELNLTSMVDMLTILVVFLLQLFSATGELFQVAKNVEPPKLATTDFSILDAPMIVVSSDGAVFNSKVEIASYADLTEDQPASWVLTNLKNALSDVKSDFERNHPPEDFKGVVVIQADRRLPFKALKKILQTCKEAGFIKPIFLGIPKDTKVS